MRRFYSAQSAQYVALRISDVRVSEMSLYMVRNGFRSTCKLMNGFYTRVDRPTFILFCIRLVIKYEQIPVVVLQILWNAYAMGID